MVLADTSALINLLRRKSTHGARALTVLLRKNVRPCITPEIYQEVLQGARDERHFGALREQLNQMPMITAHDAHNSFANAAWLYAALRWRGTIVRSSTDCLIAQIAIEHQLTLLHDDDDFIQIAKIEPRLKLA